MIEFTGTEAIVFKKKYLVISDLHIGYEIELLKKGINIPSYVPKLIEKIERIRRKYNVKNLIICGDVKHNIPKITVFEIKGLKYFLEYISNNFEKIFIAKGNHDGKIEEIVDKDNIKIVKGLKIGNYVFTHGHRRIKKYEFIIIGHNHPIFPIRTTIGETFYEKVFVIGETENGKVMILPAFSDIVGGWEVGNFNGPIAKKIERYSVYTLDGTLIYENV